MGLWSDPGRGRYGGLLRRQGTCAPAVAGRGAQPASAALHGFLPPTPYEPLAVTERQPSQELILSRHKTETAGLTFSVETSISQIETRDYEDSNYEASSPSSGLSRHRLEWHHAGPSDRRPATGVPAAQHGGALLPELPVWSRAQNIRSYPANAGPSTAPRSSRSRSRRS